MAKNVTYGQIVKAKISCDCAFNPKMDGYRKVIDRKVKTNLTSWRTTGTERILFLL
jgi:hypothetical protein